MKNFSIWSIFFIVLGMITFGLNWILESFSEPIVLLGSIFLFTGFVLSFIAISKKEKGSVKYITLTTFFIILFLVTWFDAFQVLRMMTWIKNII
ncbi:hypothetical protein [Lysinibacillus pakistanensis]|uniref:DUF3953 domain-containing protein n=1 Tax=Lysinibacillus pakistanensis TaxID=759811 RepID=A0ABX6DHR7_9BACI|nr:hypothetical protein GDS87_17520 [Lysinibacillus pakistanensis]